MTDVEFKRIKGKIAELKTKSAESTGKIKAIEDVWQNKYGFKTLEEAEKKLAEIDKEIDEKNTKKETLMKKLEESFPWEKF